MLLENVLKEYISAIRLSPNIYDVYSIDFQTANIVLHYLSRNSNRKFFTYWHNWNC